MSSTGPEVLHEAPDSSIKTDTGQSKGEYSLRTVDEISPQASRAEPVAPGVTEETQESFTGDERNPIISAGHDIKQDIKHAFKK